MNLFLNFEKDSDCIIVGCQKRRKSVLKVVPTFLRRVKNYLKYTKKKRNVVTKVLSYHTIHRRINNIRNQSWTEFLDGESNPPGQ